MKFTRKTDPCKERSIGKKGFGIHSHQKSTVRAIKDDQRRSCGIKSISVQRSLAKQTGIPMRPINQKMKSGKTYQTTGGKQK